MFRHLHHFFPMRLTGTEIFAVPVGTDVGHDDNESVWIIHSPVKDEIALVAHDDFLRFLQYFEDGVSPEDDQLEDLISEMVCKEMTPQSVTIPDIRKTSKLSILPNHICNFSCSYCYSAAGRSTTRMSWEKMQSALDFFIDENRIAPQPLSIFISGGGEPLLSWDTVSKAITYARTRSEEKGFSLQISIITNGSLLTEEIAEFAAVNNCSVCVSFEVLPQLQESQRKYFQAVSKNIEMLGRKKVRTLLNSTITPLSVDKMQEMVLEVIRRYPFVDQYTMEPVTGVSLFQSSDELRKFYDAFFEGYIACKQIADSHGINLRFTFDDALRGTSVRHCPGKFCLTPQGDITICHLASSPKEMRYADCVYGRIEEDGGVFIDTDKFSRLYGKNVFAYNRCRDCFAKWSCGGECMTRNDTYPPDYMEEVCGFNRRFVKHLLIERVRKNVEEEYNMSLEEYVRQ